MKRFFALAAACAAFAAHADINDTYEITTILGQPAEEMPFVNKILKERVDFGQYSRFEVENSTEIYSLLFRRGVNVAFNIESLAEGGGFRLNTLSAAVGVGAAHAPVVFTSHGPLEEDLCSGMMAHGDSVLVAPAGSSGLDLTAHAHPRCQRGNVLIVAALRPEGDALDKVSNFGELVHLAAPALQEVTGADGRTSTQFKAFFAAALVAADLAVYARSTTLRGEELLKKFFEERTRLVPALAPKVREGRVYQP